MGLLYDPDIRRFACLKLCDVELGQPLPVEVVGVAGVVVGTCVFPVGSKRGKGREVLNSWRKI